MRLHTVFEGYFLSRQNLSKTTVNSYQIYFDQFADFVGPDTEFDAITSRDVRAFLNHLGQRGLSKSSLLRVWATLSSL